MPRVIVISPYYNRADFVDRTVEGIRSQTYEDYEAHFVDDGSEDGTYQALSRHAAPRIVVSSQLNKGLTKTLIDVIDATDSEFIAIQGSGDVSLPARLERQVACLSDDPAIVMAGCHRRSISEMDDDESVARPRIEDDPLKQLFVANPFSHGEVMIRRSAYEKAGGYRTFFTFRQDLDLWLRLCALGRPAIVPEILYQNYALKESVTGNARKLALAMTCRDFAIHCAQERSAGREDPLDHIGPAAALLRPSSATLADQLAYAARRRAVRGLKQDARHLLDAAKAERLTLKVVLAELQLAIPNQAFIRSKLKAVKSMASAQAGRLWPG